MIFQNCLTTILLATALCLSFDTATCSTKPGARVQVSKKGFDYATQIGIDKLYETMRNTRIPDMEKNGGLYYKLSNIKLISVSRPFGKVNLLPGRGLNWHVTLNDLQIGGNYYYSKKIWFFTLRRSGSMKLTMSGTQVDLTVLPTRTNNGGLNVRATGCSCSTKLQIRVSSWFLRIILYFFKGRITRMMQDQICKSAVSAINNQVAPKVTQFPVTYTLAGDFVLDYGLISNPVISDKYLQTNHKGMIYAKNNKGTIPFTPNDMPNIFSNDKMLYFVISSYVFDTWSLAAHKKKLLQYTLSSQTLPAQSRDFLKTTCPNSFCIGTIMPQIGEKFPNSMIQVTFSTSDAPKMYFRKNKIQLSIPTVLQFYLVQPNKPLVTVFTITLNFSAELSLRLRNNNIYFSVTKMSFTLGRISGAYAGKYDVKQLQQGLQTITDNLIPYLNQFGATGMPIAIPKGASVSNSEFLIEKDAIVLGTDFKI